MPQGSAGYAIGRISVRNRGRLDAAKLDRLLAAQQPQEAQAILQEMGWGGGEKVPVGGAVSGSGDFERLVVEHTRQACAFVREVSPDANATDCFMIRYDIHNLKILLKARCLGQEPEYLSPCGTLGIGLLRHAVAEGKYTGLPDELAGPLAELEKRLAVKEDPLDIDVTLDRAMFRWVFGRLGRVKSKAIKKYFTARADLLNALIVLRVRAMGRSAAFLKDMLIPGGEVDLRKWEEAYSRDETLPRLLAGYGRRVTEAVSAAVKDPGALHNLERVADDYLLSLFVPYRMRADTLETVIGYLLAQEREAAAVRLVMAGKLNGFSAMEIRERLRELYG